MTIGDAFARAKRFVLTDLWESDLAGLQQSRRAAFRWLRTLAMSLHEFDKDRCALRAASLALIFTFSLAPALAVGFSVAKGFGAQDKVKAIIYQQFGLVDATGAPVEAGAQLRGLFDRIIGYVENTNVGALGLIGTLLVLYAAFKVLAAVETTMNQIWAVRRTRSLMRRIIDYTAVLLVLPLMLILTALVNATVQSQAVLERIPASSVALAWLLSLFLAVLALTFLYFFFPNTRVPFRAALVGAVVAAVALQALQYAYIKLQVGVANYNAIYGTFAALPIFLALLYASWLVVLFGAEISFAYANQSALEFGGLNFAPSPAYLEHVALGAMALAGRAFHAGDPPPTAVQIATALAAPLRVVNDVVSRLCAARLLSEVQGENPAFQPATSLEKITLGQIISAFHARGDQSEQTMSALDRLGITALLRRHQEAARAVRNMTLLEVVQTCGANGAENRKDPSFRPA